MLKNQRTIIRRCNGDTLQIADIIAGDETGIAILRLKGSLVERLVEGTVIAIRNGRVMVVKGHIRLEIDRWGKVTIEVKSPFLVDFSPSFV